MLCKVLRRGRIELYAGGLSADDARLTGVNTVASLQEALYQRVAACGDTRVAVIPEGPYVIPRCRVVERAQE
jgi:hypothetical protein